MIGFSGNFKNGTLPLVIAPLVRLCDPKLKAASASLAVNVAIERLETVGSPPTLERVLSDPNQFTTKAYNDSITAIRLAVYDSVALVKREEPLGALVETIAEAIRNLDEDQRHSLLARYANGGTGYETVAHHNQRRPVEMKDLIYKALNILMQRITDAEEER